MAKVSTVTDEAIEQAIDAVAASGAEPNQSNVRKLTGGSPNSVNERIQKAIDRRKSAVEPTPDAAKLFAGVWGQLLLVARGEETERDAALAEAQSEIARLSIAHNAALEEIKSVKAEAAAEVAAARQAAEEAVRQAKEEIAGVYKELAGVDAQRAMLAAEKTELLVELKEAQKEAATAQGKLEAFQQMKAEAETKASK